MNPFRVHYADLIIECASAEDVALLVPLLSQAVRAVEKPSASTNEREFLPNGSRWNERRAREYYGRLEGKRRQVLDALYDHPDGRLQRQLQETAGLQNGMELGGVLAALTKQAKKVAADPTDVFTKHPVSIGEEQTYEYRLSPGLRQALQSLKKAKEGTNGIAQTPLA